MAEVLPLVVVLSIAFAVIFAAGLSWRAERDIYREQLRQLNAMGWFALPPSTVRVGGTRVDTARATILPPPPRPPTDCEEPPARDTLPCESGEREIR